MFRRRRTAHQDWEFEETQRRTAFSRVIRSFLGWVLLIGVPLGGVLAYSFLTFVAPGPLTKAQIVNLPANMGRADIAATLQQNGVISDARVMSFASLVQGMRGATLKAGEYSFPPKASMADVFNIIASGRTVMYKLSVPEGWTTTMVVDRIKSNELMSGEVSIVPPEGAVKAETYLFPRGTDRQALVDKMTAAQKGLIAEVWAMRPADSLIKSPEELVTLASIIEKETARAEERPRVAAVFLNRLKAGMRLQSDPTIIYGIVGGLGKLERPLTRDDIDTPTPYNTYTINGLPPGPIATPGRDALIAVFKPALTKDLYFVADGTGGHAFAETLEQHNENVKTWRKIESGEIKPQPAPAPAPQAAPQPEPEIVPQVEQPALPTIEEGSLQETTNPAAVVAAVEDMSKVEEVPEPIGGLEDMSIALDAAAAEQAVALAAAQEAERLAAVAAAEAKAKEAAAKANAAAVIVEPAAPVAPPADNAAGAVAVPAPIETAEAAVLSPAPIATAEVVVLQPGKVMEIKGKLIPIPLLKTQQ